MLIAQFLCSTKVVPTAVTTGIDIGLSNLSLKTVTLTLYSEFRMGKQIQDQSLITDTFALTRYSDVQVINAHLCAHVRLSLSTRGILRPVDPCHLVHFGRGLSDGF